MSDVLLSARNIHTYYGKIIALRGVDIDVHKGEIVTMIGANGAGKSTLMMTICGDPHPREGQVIYDGQDITAMPTHEIMRLGIAQSVQQPLVHRPPVTAVLGRVAPDRSGPFAVGHRHHATLAAGHARNHQFADRHLAPAFA